MRTIPLLLALLACGPDDDVDTDEADADTDADTDSDTDADADADTDADADADADADTDTDADTDADVCDPRVPYRGCTGYEEGGSSAGEWSATSTWDARGNLTHKKTSRSSGVQDETYSYAGDQLSSYSSATDGTVTTTTTYAYDGDGNRISATSTDGWIHRWTYDDAGRQLSWEQDHTGDGTADYVCNRDWAPEEPDATYADLCPDYRRVVSEDDRGLVVAEAGFQTWGDPIYAATLDWRDDCQPEGYELYYTSGGMTATVWSYDASDRIGRIESSGSYGNSMMTVTYACD